MAWLYVALISGGLGAVVALSLTLFALLFLKKKKKYRPIEERRQEYMRTNSRQRLSSDGRIIRPESMNWLNLMIKIFYETNRNSIFLGTKETLDPLLADVKPGYISKIALTQFDFGSSTPVIEGVTGSETQSEPQTTPSGAPDDTFVPKRFYILEMRPVISSNDFKMMFKVEFKFKNISIDVLLKDVHYCGKCKIVVELDKSKSFPCVNRVFITLMERPKVDFNIEFLTSLDIDLLPGLKDWIRNIIEDSVAKMLVFPGRIYLDFQKEHIQTMIIPRNPILAIGVLIVDVELYLLSFTAAPYNQELHIKVKTQNSDRESNVILTNDSSRTVKMFNMFVYDYDAVLKVSVQKANHMQAISGQFIAHNKYVSTEIILLEAFREAVIERTLENRAKNIGLKVSAKIGILPMVPIHQVNTDVKDYRLVVGEEQAMGGSKLKPEPILGTPSGVLQIHTHYANGLISEDFNGKSDPYLKLFINGDISHKSKTIPKTLNPVFNDIFEETVNDINTVNSIKLELYDEDDIGTDDFLGYTLIDLPSTNAYNFMKRYDLTRKPGETAGEIFVSVIFRDIHLTKDIHRSSSSSVLEQRKSKSLSSETGHKEKKNFLKKRLFKSNSYK